MRPIHAAERHMYVPPRCLPAGRKLRDAPPFRQPVLRLAAAGSRCHNKSNTLPQLQQQLADILVRRQPNNYVVASCGPLWLVVVVVVGGGCAACKRLVALFSRQRSFLLYCDMCLRVRGCPVLFHIELSVSAWCHKTRVLPHARRLLQ